MFVVVFLPVQKVYSDLFFYQLIHLVILSSLLVICLFTCSKSNGVAVHLLFSTGYMEISMALPLLENQPKEAVRDRDILSSYGQMDI